MLGEPGAGVRLQRRYEDLTGGRPADTLIAWYASFRALLRARLAALHSLEPGPRTRDVWLAQADRYLNTALDYSAVFA